MTTKPEFDSTNLFVFLFEWKKPLLLITFGAAIISSVVSFLIEEKFQSTVILFPAETSSVSKALLAENYGGKSDILRFGEEEQAEQLLQILVSDEIRNRIVEKYNLMEHYDIKPEDNYPFTKLAKEYEDNINFKRTEFQSVRIDVFDKNPDTAAFIANDIAALLDSVSNRMQRERAVKALAIVEGKYNTLKNQITTMEDSLTKFRKLGVLDYEIQIEMFTEQYSKALAEGKPASIKSLDEKMNLLAKYGSTFISLRDNLVEETKKLSYLRSRYEEAEVDATQDIPHKFIVNNAYPAEKKAYPIRWLIVVISTLSSFLVGVLAIIGLENYKRLQAK